MSVEAISLPIVDQKSLTTSRNKKRKERRSVVFQVREKEDFSECCHAEEIGELITHYTFYSKAPLTEMVKGKIRRPYGAYIINSLNNKRE